MLIAVTLQSCSSPESAAANKDSDSTSYYTANDFNTIRKTDAHVHVQTKDSSFVQQAIEDNFNLFTINYDDVNEPPPMEMQQEDALIQQKKFPPTSVVRHNHIHKEVQ
jgi:hypothetical protein